MQTASRYVRCNMSLKRHCSGHSPNVLALGLEFLRKLSENFRALGRMHHTADPPVLEFIKLNFA